MTEKVAEGKAEVLQEIKERRAGLTNVKAMLHLLPDGYKYWLGFFGAVSADVPMNKEIVNEFDEKMLAMGWKLFNMDEHEDMTFTTREYKHTETDISLTAYIKANMDGSTCPVLSKVVKQTIFYSKKECANV